MAATATVQSEIDSLYEQIDALKKRVTELRRTQEPEVVSNYTFRSADGAPVTLRQLFGKQRDLLVVHNMGQKCVYCTLWADSVTGYTDHLLSRCSFALSSPDEPPVLKAFAASRGWNFPVVSHAGSTFAKDMGFNPTPNEYHPGISGYRLLDDGTIVRTGWARFGPGDDFCPTWPMFDLLWGGAGDWAPKLQYSKAGSCGGGCCCH